jgi:tetratricopeptide (TPR) repeat protein
MNLFEQMVARFKSSESSPASSIDPVLRTNFEAARRAKLSEDYPLALANLDAALESIKGSLDHPAAVEIFLQRADVYIRQGNYAEAVVALDGARAKAGDHRLLQVYVTLGQGRLAFAEGRLEEAGAYYEQGITAARALQAAGAEGRAQGLRGELALYEKNASYAQHLLREALPKLNSVGDGELSPLFVGVLGQANVESGALAEGIRLIERALKIAEQLGDVVNQRRWALALGEHALRESRYTEARIYLKLAVERFGEQRTGDHVRALGSLAHILDILGQHNEALAYAERALSLAQGGDAETAAMAAAAMGSTLRGAGRSRDAIPHLRAAEAHIPAGGRVELLRTLAIALDESGETDAAQEVATQASALAESHGTMLERAQTRRDLGLLNFRAQRFQEALTVWTPALALFEEQNAHAQVARLLCDMGSARKTLGMHARALRDFETALTVLNSVDASDLETRGLVYSNAAHAFSEQGSDNDSVDSFFTEAIALAEKLGDRRAESLRRGNYAYFLIQTGRPRRAIALLEQAAQQSETLNERLLLAIQRDNLGLAHAASGEYSTALAWHRKALEMIQPLNQAHWRTSIEINLYRALLLMGDVDEVEGLRGALAAARMDGAPELLARALLVTAQLELKSNVSAALPLIDEALQLARRADLRRWAAEALALRADAQAALGSLDEARASWAEAAEQYNRLRMPQGKKQPAWMGTEVMRNE